MYGNVRASLILGDAMKRWATIALALSTTLQSGCTLCGALLQGALPPHCQLQPNDCDTQVAIVKIEQGSRFESAHNQAMVKRF
jgi:hypothetical protein